MPDVIARTTPGRCVTALLALLTVLSLSACIRSPDIKALPAIDDLEKNRMVILMHGYISEAEQFTPLFDALYRNGIKDDRGGGPHHYHTHQFDFSRFTRVGSDHNVSIENLAAAFSRFYHGLPQHCPVCAERASAPVEVTIIARSLGGLVSREFLLQQHEKQGQLISQIPGEMPPQSHWKLNRMITLGSPFYGSTKTLYSKGFLSILVNGVIRTGIMGFVNPESGGAFGNIIDAQARAIRFGSVFLWNQHMRWRALVETYKKNGEQVPPWLVVAGVGHIRPQIQGDAVTRFVSANIAPTFPDTPIETLITDLRHQQLFRSEESGRIGRELGRLSQSFRYFIEHGTLGPLPHNFAAPWMLTTGPNGPTLSPMYRDGTAQKIPPSEEQLPRQMLYLQPRPPAGANFEVEQDDLERKLFKLKRLFSKDQADLWFRFYDGWDNNSADAPPTVLALDRHLSFFRNGIEVSRNWSDLGITTEADAAKQEVPTIHAMERTKSHLITIPDLRPTGDYELIVRIALPGQALALAVEAEDIYIKIEGQENSLPAPYLNQGPDLAPRRYPSAPLTIEPHQTNLIQVYLNGNNLRRKHPNLTELRIRELFLRPVEN